MPSLRQFWRWEAAGHPLLQAVCRAFMGVCGVSDAFSASCRILCLSHLRLPPCGVFIRVLPCLPHSTTSPWGRTVLCIFVSGPVTTDT